VAFSFSSGWFTRVNGVRVIQRDVGLGHTTYTVGYPRGVLWHYTAGCGSDISGVLKARGISVTFSVDRDGVIYEYLPLDTAGWHGFEASHYYVGIEHTALPGTCELTDVQLESSAKLSAAIIERTQQAHSFTIPARYTGNGPGSVGIPDFKPGFIDHRDGKSDWNQNGHTDHLYSWSWTKYLAAVAGQGDDEMTDQQLEQLRAATAALNGVDDFLAGQEPPEAAAPERARMYRALTRAASLPTVAVGTVVAQHTHAYSGETGAS
jgi:hypothetical protein